MNSATEFVRQQNAAPPRKRLRILFLAARPATVGPLREALKKDAEIEFHLAVDPDDAAAAAANIRFDLILIDLPWAGRASERLIARLRESGNGARFAVLGDLSGNRAREAARRIGANGHTPDPRSPNLRKVVCALARPQASQTPPRVIPPQHTQVPVAA